MSSNTSSGMDLRDMRTPYHNKNTSFDECDLVSKEPIRQFGQWFDEASKNEKIIEPNAMALATADRSGRVSVRMVLLKGWSESGFTFFTNYESHKGKDLKENPNCSLLFYWEPLKRQIRIEGRAEKIPECESEEYFSRRPVDSQIGAAISKQSTPVANRQILCDLFHKMEDEFVAQGKKIPKPECWGGYIVRPEVVEFWQGQTTRVHDRIVFRRLKEGETTDPSVTKQGEGGWVYERLW